VLRSEIAGFMRAGPVEWRISTPTVWDSPSNSRLFLTLLVKRENPNVFTIILIPHENSSFPCQHRVLTTPSIILAIF
jgi:hypothetical protein